MRDKPSYVTDYYECMLPLQVLEYRVYMHAPAVNLCTPVQ